MIPELEFVLNHRRPAAAGSSRSSPAAFPSIVTLTLNPALDESLGVDQIVADRKLRCDAPRRDPGGGGINVARAVQRLGGRALAVYARGGPDGLLLEALLAREGVEQRPVPIRGWTRRNVNVLERSTGRQFRFVLPGPELRRAEWQDCLKAVSGLRPAPDFMVASGSLPPGVPADFYARLAAVARRRGARFVLDAAGESLRLGAGEGVFLLKPSLREFQDLTGQIFRNERDLLRRGKRFLEEGNCETLVISLGSSGAVWFTQGAQGRLHAPVVPVRSGVGAGDAMVAGIVLALSRGAPFPEAVRYGLAAAAAAVMNPGTQLCRRKDVERLFRQLAACA